MSAARERLAELLAADELPVASDHGAPEAVDPAGIAARGPRAAARPGEYELLVAAIREAYLLHYSRARVVATEDEDLALLAGDRLYALGLERLAALGDLDAVAELADLISLGAAAQAAGEEDLAEAAWEAGATAVGWGATPELERAKRQACEQSPRAAQALRAAAAERRAGAPPGA